MAFHWLGLAVNHPLELGFVCIGCVVARRSNSQIARCAKTLSTTAPVAGVVHETAAPRGAARISGVVVSPPIAVVTTTILTCLSSGTNRRAYAKKFEVMA